MPTNDQLLTPLRLKGSGTAPKIEGLYCFISPVDNRRFRLMVKSTLAGNIIGQPSDLNPWLHQNVRNMPTGLWFGPFFSNEDCTTLLTHFQL